MVSKTNEYVDVKNRLKNLMIAELMTMGHFYKQTVEACFDVLMSNPHYYISDEDTRVEMKKDCVKEVILWFNENNR